MENQILEYLKNVSTATFIDLSNNISGFSGEELLGFKDYKNVLLCPQISNEAIEALSNLKKNRKIEYKAVEPGFYLARHNISLNHPIATEGTDYEVPHWLPVSIQII